jgi:titin
MKKNLLIFIVFTTLFSFCLVGLPPSGTELHFTWTPNPAIELVSKYKIEYQKFPGSTNWMLLTYVPASTNVAVVYGIESGYTYKFRIFAVNSVGVGTNSSNIIIIPTNTPTAVSNYSVIIKNPTNVSSPFIHYSK